MVEHALPSLPPVWSIDDIDCITELLTKLLTSSAKLVIPQKSFHSYRRPNWSSNLKEAQSRAKETYKTWRMHGKPSDPSNVFRCNYKDAKRIVRKAFRKYKRNGL